jgi:glycosyltransferase involved in cell wall biosynthesis
VLEAIAPLAGVHLDVYGAGTERAALEATARELALGARVRFHGFASYDELPDIYRSFDALVVPSRRTARWVEQFGRVAVEAMASGVPVLASADGALPEVVGDAGMLVPEDDVQAWRRAISDLRDDLGARSRLALVAQARAQRWSWPRVAHAHRALYDAAISRAGEEADENVPSR